MDCCAPLLKILLYLFNLLFFLIGAAFVALGTYVVVSMEIYINFLEESLRDGDKNLAIMTYSIFIIGAVLLMISFTGCIGLYKENNCMMNTFTILLSFVLIGQIGLVALVFILEANVYSFIENGMKKTINDRTNGSNASSSLFWNKVQEENSCCGISGPNDWKNGSVPATCCKIEISGCNKTSADLHKTGCLKVFRGYLEDNMFRLGYIGICVAAVELIAIITACLLANNYGKMGFTNKYVHPN